MKFCSFQSNISQSGSKSYSKAETLSDSTKTLYGLETNAFPNDVFNKISGMYQYGWRRILVQLNIKTNNVSNQPVIKRNDEDSVIVYYSEELEVSNNSFKLKNPRTVSFTNTNMNVLTNKAPCYITNSNLNNTIYYLPEGSNAYNGTDWSYTIMINGGSQQTILSPTATIKAKKVEKVTVEYIGDWEEIYSPNRNAYPDSGISDGYEYRFVGRPYDKFFEVGPKIATGSYTGTGACGPNNPNTLSFDFAPKLLVIQKIDNNSLPTIIFAENNSAKSISHIFGGGDLTVTTSGNSISWYHTGNTWTASSSSGGSPEPFYQLNLSNVTYFYAAFG